MTAKHCICIFTIVTLMFCTFCTAILYQFCTNFRLPQASLLRRCDNVWLSFINGDLRFVWLHNNFTISRKVWTTARTKHILTYRHKWHYETKSDARVWAKSLIQSKEKHLSMDFEILLPLFDIVCDFTSFWRSRLKKHGNLSTDVFLCVLRTHHKHGLRTPNVA